jgi:Fibronectin type III domain
MPSSQLDTPCSPSPGMNFEMHLLKPTTTAGLRKHGIPARLWLKCLGASLVLLWNLPIMAAPPASPVTLTWQPSPSPAIAGYNIYSGGISGIYTNKVSAGNATSVTLSNLIAGSTYHFTATCYDTVGNESAFSGEAVYTIPAGTAKPPVVLGNPSLSGGNFSFAVPGTTAASFAVEVSTDLINWVRFQTNTAPFTFVYTNSSKIGKRFFRAVQLP